MRAEGGPIAGVLLAAGLSTRMGRNKLLLEIGGEPLVRRTAAMALGAGLDPLLVVVGHEADKVRAALAGLRSTVVLNPDYAQGMNSSLRCGATALRAGLAGALVLLADMPFVTAAMVRTLCDRFRSGSAPLVLSVYGGVVAPPILYGAALFGELCALGADACGKRVVQQHRAEAIELEWPAELLADLDQPRDLERARTLLEAR